MERNGVNVGNFVVRDWGGGCRKSVSRTKKSLLFEIERERGFPFSFSFCFIKVVGSNVLCGHATYAFCVFVCVVGCGGRIIVLKA